MRRRERIWIRRCNMPFLSKIHIALLILLAVFPAGGCSILEKYRMDSRFDMAVKHNVLSPGEVFKPLDVAKKVRSGYLVIRSQSDISKLIEKNTLYCIKESINLQGKTLSIPSDCLLFFDGGSFRNGTVIGNNTIVVAKDYEIFNHGVSSYRAYKADSYKYISKNQDAIVIMGTWSNCSCGNHWTGMTTKDNNHCSSLSINNYIRLHKRGQEILFPANQEYYVYDRIVCSGYSIDFNNSIIRSIDFNKVEDESISLPKGSQSRALKSLYGLLHFNGDNAYIRNLTIDGRASQRSETPSLGTECLISMTSNTNCQLKNVNLKDAVGCGICTNAISNCSFDDVVFNGCGEHGIYTHAYKGTLFFNNCRFINCGQDPTLFKKRGASACIKFSGARDQDYAALKDLKAFFKDCVFESSSQFYVATMYSDIPFAEFLRCKWKGVKGYTIVSPRLAEQTGRLVEFHFIECDNPCYSISSYNTIRKMIRCKNVKNPFADTIELTDCEISVGYADVENKYSSMFVKQYDLPVICTNCVFTKDSEDTPVRNTIKNPRPMVFNHCVWDFKPSPAKTYRGSHFLVFSYEEGKEAPRSVEFNTCKFGLDKYRMLLCADADISFVNCVYISSYDILVDSRKDRPSSVSISNMTNKINKQVARNCVLKER